MSWMTCSRRGQRIIIVYAYTSFVWWSSAVLQLQLFQQLVPYHAFPSLFSSLNFSSESHLRWSFSQPGLPTFAVNAMAWEERKEVDTEKSEEGFLSDIIIDENGQTCAAANEAHVCSKRSYQEKPTYQSILQEYEKYDANIVSHYSGETLGYVTPWNNHGYDVAKIFADKFTYIVPVWYQIRLNSDTNRPHLTGSHDVDQAWIKEIRQASKTSDTFILPRFIFEMERLTKTDTLTIVQMVSEEAERQGFDGIVLEIIVLKQTIPLIKSLGNTLKKMKKKLIQVLEKTPNDLSHASINPSILKSLADSVHRFSFNTYHYSLSVGREGPNTPSKWVERSVQLVAGDDPSLRKKLLLGIPLYGSDGASAIVGQEYIKLLQKYQPQMHWDSKAQESYFVHASGEGQAKVYYPSLKFVSERLKMLHGLGVSGCALWDIGQGKFPFHGFMPIHCVFGDEF